MPLDFNPDNPPDRTAPLALRLRWQTHFQIWRFVQPLNYVGVNRSGPFISTAEVVSEQGDEATPADEQET